jgi:hypothetical protein
MKHPHDKPAMQPKSDAHPGLEQDSKGRPIPIKDRLPEDRAKVKRATKKTRD